VSIAETLFAAWLERHRPRLFPGGIEGTRVVRRTESPLPAPDASGIEHLMADFYHRWVGGNGSATKGEALRQAQIDLLTGKVKPQAGVSHFAHPYFWAPFILTGNWQGSLIVLATGLQTHFVAVAFGAAFCSGRRPRRSPFSFPNCSPRTQYPPAPALPTSPL
jgi:hypothetical protein